MEAFRIATEYFEKEDDAKALIWYEKALALDEQQNKTILSASNRMDAMLRVAYIKNQSKEKSAKPTLSLGDSVDAIFAGEMEGDGYNPGEVDGWRTATREEIFPDALSEEEAEREWQAL